MGPCERPSRTGRRHSGSAGLGAPRVLALGGRGPAVRGGVERGRATWAGGSAPPLPRRLPRQAGGSRCRTEVAVCGHRWWPVQTGRPAGPAHVGPQPHSSVPAPSSRHYPVSCQHQSTRLVNGLIIFARQDRTPNPTSLPPACPPAGLAACAPSVPCPGTLRGTLWPSHCPATLAPLCSLPLVRTCHRGMQQNLAEN